ncbi:MAG: hypothetical protein O3C57_06425 [Verrucomicrobia bacterium]|nr:hypothetical protein [Verrucomicrobiota bacterium]
MSTSIVALGIAAGLICALTQSGAYIFSRLFVIRSRAAALHLMTLAHVLMGLVSVIILIAMQPHDLPPIKQFGPSLLGAGGFFVLAQIGFLTLMRFTTPSSIAPLLGLKIIVLALFNLLLFSEHLRATQWGAVVLCAAAALVLNAAGEKLGARTLLLVLFSCAGYSLSDLSITRLVGHLGEPGSVRASVLGAVMCYSMLGAVALPMMLMLKGERHAAAFLRFGVPYSCLWFLAMLMLFYSMSCIGPVYAVILQSTRGLWSVLLGALIAHLGLVQVEDRIARHLVLRRALAALMMVTAIWLYSRA